MAARAFLLVALLIGGVGHAADEPILTGSTIKASDASAKAAAVFVGKITEMGDPTPTSPGVASYGCYVKVLRMLKGVIAAKNTATITTFALNREVPPKVGISYIFFASTNIDDEHGYWVIKLLLVTDDNVSMVKKLISQLPAK